MKTPRIIKSAAHRVETATLNFWLTPASTTPMAALRVGVAAVLIYQALALFSSVQTLFGPDGLIAWQALQSTSSFPLDVGSPFHLSRLSAWLQPVGLTAQGCVQLVFAVYVVSLFAMLFGFFTRTSTAIAFAMHLMLTSTAVATIYGVDQFARIALFYCIWFPTGSCWSLDVLRTGRSIQSSVTARIGIRTLQLHLALMYLATGLHKAAGAQWWNGEAIWRAITLPQLATVDMSWIANYPQLPIMIGWSTLALEVGYIFLVWHRRTRIAAVAGVISMHVGIALLMGLVSFALMMIVLNIAAFLVSTEPSKPQRGSLSWSSAGAEQATLVA